LLGFEIRWIELPLGPLPVLVRCWIWIVCMTMFGIRQTLVDLNATTK
jgi:hypothetical protein